MFKRHCSAFFLLGFCLTLFMCPASVAAEDALWEIYNTVYGGSYVTSDVDLENTYGVAYDETFLETNGYVEASARFAGYTQKFGYYTDLCIGNNPVELLDITTTGYLSGYTATFLVGGGTSIIGFYDDPSGSPTWFSQPLLNSDAEDHMRTFRAPDFNPLDPEYLIAWEDLENLGDADYNDLVLVINFLEPYEVECCEIDDDCDDGLYCNGDEQCIDSVCQPGSDPCPDDGLFCNGTEGCDEVSDVCTHSGDPCAPDQMCDEDQGICYDITLDVGDGSGFRGSVDNPLDISLDNPDDKVGNFQVDICDVDDYLTCTGCELTGRSVSCDCFAMEQGDGCCRVILIAKNPGGVIEEGTGPVVIVKYDVSTGAPAGECRDLNPEGEVVADEYGFDLTAKLLPGEFCFFDCTSDQDCDDSNVCTDEACVSGVCQYTNNTNPCADDLFCNGEEYCAGGVCGVGPEEIPCPDDGLYCNGDEGCDEENDICTHSGDPCTPPYLCDEDGGQCVMADVIVTAEPAWAAPGDVGVKVDLCLDNQDYEVGGVQVDICEEIDGSPIDCFTCVGCEMTERTVLFDCFVYELEDGCCRVILMSKHPGGVINPAICSIVKIDYTFCDPDDPECPEECNSVDCITLTPVNMVIADPYGNPLSAAGMEGEVCPFECGDVYPPESVPGEKDCGDGDVNLVDIITEVDFALGGITPDDCQLLRADVPTGTPGYGSPPYCTPPDGSVNVLDVMVIIDMALDRQDCCTYYYTGGIY